MIRNRRKFLQQFVSVVIVPCVGINYFQEKRKIIKAKDLELFGKGREVVSISTPIGKSLVEHHFAKDRDYQFYHSRDGKIL